MFRVEWNRPLMLEQLFRPARRQPVHRTHLQEAFEGESG
jgi:hypothetical protein